MCLGAVVSAGVRLREIRKELGKIPLKDYSITERKVKRAGIDTVWIDVQDKIEGQRPSRWKDMRGLLRASTLDEDIREDALKIIKSIFVAEAVVHDVLYDRIHLHELSSADTIIDVVGTLVGIKKLGIEKVIASAVNLGSGSVKTAHGILPVPAPATVELLKNIPAYSSAIPLELTTPTGAAILKFISSGFGAMPTISVSKTGLGAGKADLPSQANVLRLFIGKAESTCPEIQVIETNIDDMNPQIYDYVMQMLFDEGALDVFLTPIIMKKGRPGIKLSVLCLEENKDKLIKIILKETTSIGVRYYRANRATLQRETTIVETPIGKLRQKTARTEDGYEKSSFEFEDVKKAAKAKKIPLIEAFKKAGQKKR